jgi:hypothetical protein
MEYENNILWQLGKTVDKIYLPFKKKKYVAASEDFSLDLQIEHATNKKQFYYYPPENPCTVTPNNNDWNNIYDNYDPDDDFNYLDGYHPDNSYDIDDYSNDQNDNYDLPFNNLPVDNINNNKCHTEDIESIPNVLVNSQSDKHDDDYDYCDDYEDDTHCYYDADDYCDDYEDDTHCYYDADDYSGINNKENLSPLDITFVFYDLNILYKFYCGKDSKYSKTAIINLFNSTILSEERLFHKATLHWLVMQFKVLDLPLIFNNVSLKRIFENPLDYRDKILNHVVNPLKSYLDSLEGTYYPNIRHNTSNYLNIC